jgi:hypothetical protein
MKKGGERYIIEFIENTEKLHLRQCHGDNQLKTDSRGMYGYQ